jgi:phosphotransferase system enzyme I (PtsI)
LQEVQAELREQGVAYGAEVRIGAMIEVPAAALIVEHLLDELDFLSIGTNDLVQYTLAADRLNERVANVYDPYHPALIRLLAYIARSAKQREISLSVCGELAGESLAVPLWFALGVKELSMSASRLLPVKETILQVRADACTLLLDSLLQCRTSAEVRQLLTSALTNDERSH